MSAKDYARLHRLASENLLDATQNPKGMDIPSRVGKLINARDYARRAFEEADDEFTIVLNSHISAAIESAIKLLERQHIKDRKAKP